MNIKQVKEKYSLEGLLQCLGHNPDPHKSKGHDLWYRSPFRSEEREPSFHIHTRHDIWKDFGLSGKSGGDMISFVQRLLEEEGRSYSISDVLEWFRNFSGTYSAGHIAKRTQTASMPKEEPLKLLSVRPIFSTALFDYMEERGIATNIGERYLKQVYFLHQPSSRKIYGLGIRNQSGGYEIRNGLGFKGVVGKKDISWIYSKINSTTVDVFEGTFDFLSHRMLFPDRSTSDGIILHTTSLTEPAIRLIFEQGYKLVNLWLDNDKAGRAAEEAFNTGFEGASVKAVSKREHYNCAEDLNAWHIQQTSSSKSLAALEP